MALPHVPEARLYYRAAKQCFDDAQLLRQAERTTGAVYLAGYTVECFLNALLPSPAGPTGDRKMAIKLRVKRPDPVLRQIVDVLSEYDNAHPDAAIEAYRQNSVSVRIRIVNPEFAGKSRAQREEEVWAALDKLPEDAAAEISLLLLLTPAEAKQSFANTEFDDPIPSKL